MEDRSVTCPLSLGRRKTEEDVSISRKDKAKFKKNYRVN